LEEVRALNDPVDPFLHCCFRKAAKLLVVLGTAYAHRPCQSAQAPKRLPVAVSRGVRRQDCSRPRGGRRMHLLGTVLAGRRHRLTRARRADERVRRALADLRVLAPNIIVTSCGHPASVQSSQGVAQE